MSKAPEHLILYLVKHIGSPILCPALKQRKASNRF